MDNGNLKKNDRLLSELMEQSQRFYQNNLNLFTNSVSMLAVSSLESKLGLNLLLV